MQTCPACHAALSNNDLFLGPPEWKLQCSSCETWLTVAPATSWLFLGALLVLFAVAFSLAAPTAKLLQSASSGALLITPKAIVFGFLMLSGVLLFATLHRLVLLVGTFRVYDEASSLRLASRIVLGFLVALLIFLVWVLWRFS